jgi:hypothetical protein
VIAATTKRRYCTAPLAALLLVIQGLAGGGVALAHASEPLTAPGGAHIEAQHRAACLVLHDELRCALCHYAGSQLTPAPLHRSAPVAATVTERPAGRPEPAPAADPEHLTAPPRAPPGSRS